MQYIVCITIIFILLGTMNKIMGFNLFNWISTNLAERQEHKDAYAEEHPASFGYTYNTNPIYANVGGGSSSEFTGVGDLIIGKETNKSVQMLGLAVIAIGAIYLFGGMKK